MAGDHLRARHYLDAAERVTYDGPQPNGTASWQSSLALTRCTLALDGVGRAQVDAEKAYELEPPDSPWRSLAALVVGLTRVMQGNTDAALPFLEEAGRAVDSATSAYALAELSLARLARGECQLAAELAADAHRLVRAHDLDDLVVAAAVQAAVAHAALAHGDRLRARTALAVAAQPLRHLGASLPMDGVHVRILLASVALELGLDDMARDLVDRAGRVAATVSDTGALDTQLVRLRVRLANAGEGGPVVASLAGRELEVLALLPLGLTTREIGDELFLSHNTIKTHLRSIYRKLGASSRREALTAAHRLGLLPGESLRRAFLGIGGESLPVSPG